jgi:DnaJ-class molecular chaperone
MSENFYNILGVGENATKDEIKKAYRSLQMKHHPDKNPNNPEAFKMTQKINEAYETLGDDQRKEEYDMMRNGNGMRHFRNGVEVPVDDIFNMFFGGGNPFAGMPGMGGGMPAGGKVHIFHGGPMGFQQAMNKPIPIMKSLQINMEQVLSGASLPVEIERWIMENGSKVFEKETIYVDVPPGIDENEMIILRDRGNIINDQCKGDIKINILVQNNSVFKRSGLDLLLEKHISLKESLCGFTFELKYLNGKSYTLNNNKGNIVPPEYKKIYPGMGLKRGEHKGNMIILFHVDFPDKLTDKQIEKLMEIL